MKSIKLDKLNESHTQRLSVIANEHDIWVNVRNSFPHPYSLSDAQFFIHNIANNNTNLIRGIFYATRLVGVIGIHPQSDIYSKSAEIGYWIAKDFWGKGIATIAVSEICKLAFDTLDIVRIYAGVFEHNTASQKVLLNTGFKYEGTAIKAVYKNGQFCDELRYGMVR